MKKKHKPPKKKKWATKLVPKVEISFNLTQMVHNYSMIKRLIGLFEQTVNTKGYQMFPESTDFFSGMIKGYDDWLDVLGVDQDKFDAAFEKLDKSNIIADADATYARIVEQKNKARKLDKRIVLSGEDISRQDVGMAKQIFDQQLSKVGG